MFKISTHQVSTVMPMPPKADVIIFETTSMAIICIVALIGMAIIIAICVAIIVVALI
jgi:hypothetical protein